MRISEVAALTGLAVSNIRFYEKKGLLAVQREKESKYRDYSEEDIERLKIILLYRKMNFSIDTIYLLLQGKADLSEALIRQEEELAGQMDMLQGSIELCRKMQREPDPENINVDAYLHYVCEEEKNGKRFGELEELLEDLAVFSRVSVFRGDPHVGQLFQNVWVARGIALFVAVLLTGVPMADIIIMLQKGETVRWFYIFFWIVVWTCLAGQFFLYRKKEKKPFKETAKSKGGSESRPAE